MVVEPPPRARAVLYLMACIALALLFAPMCVMDRARVSRLL